MLMSWRDQGDNLPPLQAQELRALRCAHLSEREFLWSDLRTGGKTWESVKPEPLGLRSALPISVFSREDWWVFRKCGVTWKYTFSTRQNPEDPRVEFFTQHREPRCRCLRHEGANLFSIVWSSLSKFYQSRYSITDKIKGKKSHSSRPL